MEERYKKAQVILSKEFHFTKMQADAARAKGKILMEKEDIEYLLRLKIPNKSRAACLDMTIIEYDSIRVLDFIESAKKEGFHSVTLLDKDLTRADEIIVSEKGYYIELDYIGIKVSYIFFNEEDFIKNKIFNFQNMFNVLKSVARKISS